MRKERKKKNTFLINLTYYIGGLIMSKNNIIINEARTGFPVVKNGYPVKVTYLEGYFHKTTMEGGIPPFYLETLVINEGIEEIGDSAVAYSEKLTTIKFPSTLKEIGESAFEGCVSLKNIKLPEGLKRIHKYAFEECISIELIIIPFSVTEIGYNAFQNCKNLKYFIVLNSNLSYDNIGLPDGCKIICPGKEVETI